MENNLELKDQLKSLERKLYVIYLFGFLVIVSLSILTNFILKRQAAEQATSFIKRTAARGDFRETIYTLNDAKLDYFDAVVYYKEDSTKYFSLPAQLDPNFINDERFISKLLYSRITTDLFFDSSGKHKIGSVLYIFGRLSHIPYAILIWLFFLLGTFPIVRASRHSIIEKYLKQITLQEETTRADLARRVRHDIRSPLGALLIAIKDLSVLSPKQRSIIHRSTERISEIVAELELIRSSTDFLPTPKGVIAPHSIVSLIQSIIQEKRTQHASNSNLNISPRFSNDAFFLFADVDGSDFKRTISNLIDNSIDAVNCKGLISVGLESIENRIVISITDNGSGISQDIIKKVTEKGYTNKKTGTGLGLYYAQKTALNAGGTLKIDSTLGKGTTVTIEIPRGRSPSWYVPNIEIPKNGTVIILDDQESSHLSWKLRLDSLKEQGHEFTLLQFKSPEELTDWHGSHTQLQNVIYLFDYDLGPGKITGLELLRSLKLEKSAILVTGHFDSQEIQRGCIESKIGLISKSYLSQITFKMI